MSPISETALGSGIPMMGWVFYGVLFVFWAITTALLSRVIKTHDEQQKDIRAELQRNKDDAKAELQRVKEESQTEVQKAKDEYRTKLSENNVTHQALVERLHAMELAQAQSATKESLARLESRLEQLHGDMRALAAEMRVNSRGRQGTDPSREG